MSDIGAVSSGQPSLIEELMMAPDTVSSPCDQAVESASSIDELQDKLSILERGIGGDAALMLAIQDVQTRIDGGASLDEIQSTLRRP
ncbi:MAG: hypothetical protein ACO3K7_00385 [Candidatus Marinamargulisbacteria bacterium]